MTKENLPEEKLLKLIRIKRPDKEKPKVKLLPQVKNIFEFKIVMVLVNLLLVAGACLLAVFLAQRIFFAPQEQSRPKLDAVAKGDAASATDVMAQKKPYEYYKAQFSKRDLFDRPLDQVAANASVDLTKRYKLVGIVLGDVPEAIIEDSSNRSTIFVHPGDKLDNVEIKSVEEGRIVFLQEGLEIELKQ